MSIANPHLYTGSIALFISLLQAGCQYLPIQPQVPAYSLETEQQSQAYVELRKQEAATHSLSEKAAVFEGRIFGEFKDPNQFLFGEKLKASHPLELDLEATALVLASRAAKYAVTQDTHDLQAVHAIIDSLVTLDQSNGYDGYLPYIVEPTSLKPIKEATHSNAYAQLMFAYVTVAQMVADEAIQTKIRTHTDHIAQYFIATEFKMEDSLGQTIEFSDLSPSYWQLSRSRILDLLVIIESLHYLLPPDDPKIPQLQTYLTAAEEAQYLKKIQRMRFQVLDYRIPTHSSDWLNFLRLYTLTQISEKSAYHSALQRHYQDLKAELNPFYAIFSQDESEHTNIAYYLNSFPLTLDNQPITPNEAVPLKPYPLYKKNRRTLEALTPLPLYQRSADTLEWKRNPYRSYGHLNPRERVQYPGIDFYLVYWFGRQNGMLTSDEPRD